MSPSCGGETGVGATNQKTVEDKDVPLVVSLVTCELCPCWLSTFLACHGVHSAYCGGIILPMLWLARITRIIPCA